MRNPQLGALRCIAWIARILDHLGRDGKYHTLVDMAGSYDQLFELVDLLAAAEAGR